VRCGAALRIVALALAVAACVAPSANASPPRAEAPTLSWLDAAGAARFRTTTLARAGAARVAAGNWNGGSYTTATGDTVVVYVSPAYGSDASIGRRWADFFASLPHGRELRSLTAYVAPLNEVEELCGGEALGCYGGSTLVMVGDSSGGIPPASVAAHEYGHHVAANRLNTPWLAVDWGTKRWATYMGICGRVAAGTAFPGNEDGAYRLNPGEGFAESYRVLVETGGTAAGYIWPIVDDQFRPDAHTLELVRQDVLEPWSESPARVIRAKFPGRARTWTMKIVTPLDGDLRVGLTVPNGGVDDATLLADDGRTRLATADWDGPGRKSLSYQVCGVRSVTLRVKRGTTVSRFTLRVAAP
jgi:hypothetical protein